MTHRRHDPPAVEIDQTAPMEFFAKVRYGPAARPTYLGPFPSYRHAMAAAKDSLFGGRRPGPLPPKFRTIR